MRIIVGHFGRRYSDAIEPITKPRLILCLAFVLNLLPACSTNHVKDQEEAAASEWRTKAIRSEADLDRVIAQLQNPATRFDGMLALLEFAGYPKGNEYSSDVKVNDLHAKARNAIDTCPDLDGVINTMIAGLQEPDKRLPMIKAMLWLSGGFGNMVPGHGPSNQLEKSMFHAKDAASAAMDVPTVEKALQDPDWLLRITAVDCFGNASADISEWQHLLPQIEQLAATDDDSSIRTAAVRSLRSIPGTETFLAGRETSETSPDVLLELTRGRLAGDQFHRRFLTLFVPLLSNRDEKVREDALQFIGFNSKRAPMLQFDFGTNVYEQVIASTRAKSSKERWMAAYALNDLRNINPDLSRETFLRLVRDPDETVRWQAASGLAGQLDRQDVKQAVAVLLRDKSQTVRYMTIVLVVGAQNSIPELEELSKGPDSQVTRMAADELKGLNIKQ